MLCGRPHWGASEGEENMGTYLRKSVKVGGLKFNFSSSGVGVSTGVKGLRIGVSGNGKTYVSGGCNGIYFRETLGNANSISSETNSTRVDNSGKIFWTIDLICFFLSIILFISAEKESPLVTFSGILLFFSIIAAIVHPFIWFYKISSYNTKVSNYITEIGNYLHKSDYTNIIKSIEKMKKEKLTYESIALVLNGCGVYEKYIKSALKDKTISNEENDVIKMLSEYLPEDMFTYINDHAIDFVISDILSDNIITDKEREQLDSLLKELKISENKKTEIEKLLEEYKKIEEIKNDELKIIETNEKGNNCFYIGEISVNSRSKNKYGYYYYSVSAGKLKIYDEYIEIISDGDKKFKINDILDTFIDDGVINIIINNRKTPIYISSEEPTYILAIISKLIKK